MQPALWMRKWDSQRLAATIILVIFLHEACCDDILISEPKWDNQRFEEVLFVMIFWYLANGIWVFYEFLTHAYDVLFSLSETIKEEALIYGQWWMMILKFEITIVVYVWSLFCCNNEEKFMFAMHGRGIIWYAACTGALKCFMQWCTIRMTACKYFGNFVVRDLSKNMILPLFWAQ